MSAQERADLLASPLDVSSDLEYGETFFPSIADISDEDTDRTNRDYGIITIIIISYVLYLNSYIKNIVFNKK